ncbi:hypothetical protein [Prosthecobacter sp.]|uniref:hypothetical protein n=1 Tax=Prosthecobacter sp. TaxID=1965333 RepID=UPI0037837673
MKRTISYDIDQILELAAAEYPYKGLEILWNTLEPHTDAGRPTSKILDEEWTVFTLLNFGVYMGNGFGDRMGFNYTNGIEEFFSAMQAAEKLGLVQTSALFSEVNDVLVKMGITRSLCEEVGVFCLSDFDDIVDASDLLEDEGEGSEQDLYTVFERLSAPFNFDSRWWNLEHSEVQPALIEHLDRNKDKLRFRKNG